MRDYRDSLYEDLGPDSGGDISTGEVEIVLYCVDLAHYPTLVTISRAFPNVSVGAAW